MLDESDSLGPKELVETDQKAKEVQEYKMK